MTLSLMSPRMASAEASLPRVTPRPLQPRARPAPPPNEELQGDGDFFSRQPLTGAVCRMVRYREHERPAEDILSLCYTNAGRVIVTKIRTGGQAARASVAVGDELVSIDGDRHFHGRPSGAIRAALQGPTSLVFAGFVGKLEAEVRVEHTPHKVSCGLSPSTDVANDLTRVGTPLSPRVCDPVFFSAKESLFITTPRRDKVKTPRGGEPLEAATTAGWATSAADEPRIYELNKEDAKHMLQRVLRKTNAPKP